MSLTSLEITSPDASPDSAVSWAAIIAGAVGAAALSLILLLLGSGLGLSMASPWSGPSATTFAVSTAIWLIVVQWLASGVGGYIAGRLRTKWNGIHTDEVAFRDTAHGFLAWALATLLVAGLLGSAVSSIVGGGASAVSSIASGAAPFNGTFRPAESLAALNGLDLTSGQWRLEVKNAAGLVGTLNAWSLAVTPKAGTNAYAQTFRVGFARQELSGTYIVNLNSGIKSMAGDALDSNQNAGLDMKQVLDVIGKGAAQSWQMDNRGKTMVDGKFDFGFAVDWMRKDLGLVLDEAKRNGSRVPVTALVDQFYADVQKMGGNRWDTSSLIQRLK